MSRLLWRRFVVFLLLTFFISNAQAQRTFIEDGKLNGVLPLDQSGQITYEAIRVVENVNQAELYKRARKWFVKTYTSANSVLQINDPATGELTAKGMLPLNVKIARVNYSGLMWHTLILEVKDSRYRLILTNLTIDKHTGPLQTYKLPYLAVTQAQYTTFYTGVDTQCRALVTSLESALDKADDF